MKIIIDMKVTTSMLQTSKIMVDNNNNNNMQTFRCNKHISNLFFYIRWINIIMANNKVLIQMDKCRNRIKITGNENELIFILYGII
jgi:hypothetical protein